MEKGTVHTCPTRSGKTGPGRTTASLWKMETWICWVHVWSPQCGPLEAASRCWNCEGSSHQIRWSPEPYQVMVANAFSVWVLVSSPTFNNVPIVCKRGGQGGGTGQYFLEQHKTSVGFHQTQNQGLIQVSWDLHTWWCLCISEVLHTVMLLNRAFLPLFHSSTLYFILFHLVYFFESYVAVDGVRVAAGKCVSNIFVNRVVPHTIVFLEYLSVKQG